MWVFDKVDRIRDGRTFCQRGVRAKQRGKIIFIATISFQRPEPSCFVHQKVMPDCPVPPDEIDLKHLPEGLGSDPSLAKVQPTAALPLPIQQVGPLLTQP